jgi:hypothetical protein
MIGSSSVELPTGSANESTRVRRAPCPARRAAARRHERTAGARAPFANQCGAPRATTPRRRRRARRARHRASASRVLAGTTDVRSCATCRCGDSAPRTWHDVIARGRLPADLVRADVLPVRKRMRGRESRRADRRTQARTCARRARGAERHDEDERTSGTRALSRAGASSARPSGIQVVSAWRPVQRAAPRE